MESQYFIANRGGLKVWEEGTARLPLTMQNSTSCSIVPCSQLRHLALHSLLGLLR